MTDSAPNAAPPSPPANPIPITIITGFLGSGKTTMIIKLIPQLPSTYKLALLKNEFGDLEIDSQLASSSSIAGVRELLNGCICCNLVGQLGDALETLRTTAAPDRIVIETSGSAFPATLAMEVNRLVRETPGRYALDGVLSVVDVENWEGYEDTSVTAKMQAQYTDLVVFNKWEEVGERRWDEVLDRFGDLDCDIPWVRSARGFVEKEVIFGVDGALARQMGEGEALKAELHTHNHDNEEGHQSEVEVLSVTLDAEEEEMVGVDLQKLEDFLLRAPRDEVYRIKAVLFASSPPKSSSGEQAGEETNSQPEGMAKYILNWAFGRWTFTPVNGGKNSEQDKAPGGLATPPPSDSEGQKKEASLRMTIVTARDESNKWKKRLQEDSLLTLEGDSDQKAKLNVERIS